VEIYHRNVSVVGQVHKDGRSPIHHASIYGVVETVQLLLKRGVDADTTTADGKTPVLLAAVEGHADIVRLLADYSCDVNRVYEDAMTPLSAAASGQHLRAMNGQYTVSHRLCTVGLYFHRTFYLPWVEET